MSKINRDIQELLVDYAGALREGCIPTFLKSLTREEGQSISSCDQFWDAAEVVRIMNDTGFADKAVTADVGLFISRVDANIVSRMKKAKASSKHKRPRHLQKRSRDSQFLSKSKKAEKPI